jgi:hypothetical protein
MLLLHLTRCLRVLRDAAASGGRAQRERALVRAMLLPCANPPMRRAILLEIECLRDRSKR